MASEKFMEEQPQILRLALAHSATISTQDDSLFAMRTSHSGRWVMAGSEASF
jgi:hypothetical protein